MPGRPRRTLRHAKFAGAVAPALLSLAAGGCFVESGGLWLSGDAGDVQPDRTDGIDGDVEAAEDGAIEDGVTDGLPDGSCSTDEDCNDFISCTRDLCAAGTHRCSHAANPAWCSPGLRCDPAAGCVATAACSTDEDCNDGVECTIDRCVGGTECLHDPPDVDGDGTGDLACGGGDCDDANPTVYPAHGEICDDRIDNDCNGAIDYRDDDCPPPYGNDACDRPVRLLPGDGWIVGDSTGYPAESVSGVCGGDGPEAYYAFTLDAPASVVLDTIGSDFDTLLYVRTACDGEEMGCNDDRKDDPAEGSRIVFRALPAGDYLVIVDGRGAGDSGRHRLNIAFGSPAAGNAACDAEIDVTEGGTVVGYLNPRGLFDEDDWGACGGMFGNQERFVLDLPGGAFLHISTRGSFIPTVLYARADGCNNLFPEGIGCAAGAAYVGASLDIAGRSGTIHFTLDTDAADREGRYYVDVNP